MSNSNYIQNVENVQQVSKKYYSYLYEIRHIPTGLLYVGSRSSQRLKKFEDCYTDDYLGSSSNKEGPFSKKDTETNPQDYVKTVLKVFYDEDPKKAWKNEHGSNGLIMTYWTMYGKDKVLNQQCFLGNGSKVFSTAGQNAFANKTEEELASIKQKMSITYNNKSAEEKKEIRQKKSEANKGKYKGENNPMFGKNAFANKTEAEMAAIAQKISDKLSGENNGSCNQYQHPYNHEIIGNGNKISHDIRKNYPNKKQWNEFTKSEKDYYRVISQDASCCIQNKN